MPFNNTYIEEAAIPGVPVVSFPKKQRRIVDYKIARGTLQFSLPDIFLSNEKPVTVEIYDFYGNGNNLVFKDSTGISSIFEPFQYPGSGTFYTLKIIIPLAISQYVGDNECPRTIEYMVEDEESNIEDLENIARLSVSPSEVINDGYISSSDVFTKYFSSSAGSYFVKITVGDKEIRKVLNRKTIY